jgi:hypothetical protein
MKYHRHEWRTIYSGLPGVLIQRCRKCGKEEPAKKPKVKGCPHNAALIVGAGWIKCGMCGEMIFGDTKQDLEALHKKLIAEINKMNSHIRKKNTSLILSMPTKKHQSDAAAWAQAAYEVWRQDHDR